MATEFTIGSVTSSLRGLMQALWGVKSGDDTTMQLVEASGGALRVAPRGFTPSAYSANKSATTTVTGQSEAIAVGATSLRVRNLDTTNYARIAFGVDAATAEANAATGVAIEFGQVEILGIPDNALYYAWLGDTGTVLLNIVQGN